MSSPSWALGHVFPGRAVRIRACKACWAGLFFSRLFFCEKLACSRLQYSNVFYHLVWELHPPSRSGRSTQARSLARLVGRSAYCTYVCT